MQGEDGSGTRSSEASDDTAPGAREQEATGQPLPAPMPWQSSVEGVAHIMEQLTRRSRLPSGNSSGAHSRSIWNSHTGPKSSTQRMAAMFLEQPLYSSYLSCTQCLIIAVACFFEGG